MREGLLRRSGIRLLGGAKNRFPCVGGGKDLQENDSILPHFTAVVRYTPRLMISCMDDTLAPASLNA
ncbi:MAG: hypothetical protein NTU41_12395 [Chloroflexi bacterium]|nr:hypothetical protein [Chloroflexota bacterium]